MTMLPGSPGAYALQLSISEPHRMQVGRLGEFTFPAGEYIYLGSALGPGGLRARLGRHLSIALPARPHWHIDYLRAGARVHAYCYFVLQGGETPGAAPIECLWSSALASSSGASVPVRGFGASDCRCGCPAHLVAFEKTAAGAPTTLAGGTGLEVLAVTAGAPPATLVWGIFPLVTPELMREG